MPKFGLLSNPLIPVPKQIVTFAKLGFDYIEISIEEPSTTPQILLKQKERILNLLARHKMFDIGHTAYWVQFGTSHEKVRKGWVEEGKDMIYVASELKINFLSFHFYGGWGQTARTSSSIKVFIANFIKSMKELNIFAKEKKIKLMLENVPTINNRNYDIKQFSYIIRSVPDLIVHLDVGHAFIEGRMKRIKNYIDTFENKIFHIHLHDNHGLEDEHLPFGAGNIDFKKVVQWLKEINYDKTITFEVFTSYKDAVRSREIFKKLWSKY